MSNTCGFGQIKDGIFKTICLNGKEVIDVTRNLKNIRNGTINNLNVNKNLIIKNSLTVEGTVEGDLIINGNLCSDSNVVIDNDLVVQGNIINTNIENRLLALENRVNELENELGNTNHNVSLIITELAMMANATVSVVAQRRQQLSDGQYSNFLVEQIDSNDAFDGTFFTAPVDAKYFFAFYAFGTFPPSFMQFVQVRRIVLGGNPTGTQNVDWFQEYQHFTTTGGQTWGVSGTIEMEAGERLGFWGGQRYDWGVVSDSGVSIFSIDL